MVLWHGSLGLFMLVVRAAARLWAWSTWACDPEVNRFEPELKAFVTKNGHPQ